MKYFKRFRFIFLFIFIIITSWQYFFSRPTKLNWSENEAYLMRFQWLDSVNLYLKSNKILMMPPSLRLEDICTGEDQGYPLVLSTVGKIAGIQEMTFATFIHFNYFLFIALGTISSILIFISFQNVLPAIIFYWFYLRLNIYHGGLDHHWMSGAYVVFYISFLMFYILRKKKINWLLLGIYFSVAGFANIIREGDGVMGILLLALLMLVILIQEGFRKHLKNLSKKAVVIAILICIYYLPQLVLNSVRVYRDQVNFGGQSSDMITHHGLWHNAFMGLGFIPNKHGIEWRDDNNLQFVRQIKPDAQYMTNEYYDILRYLYFKYSFETPELWWGNFIAKIGKIHHFISSLFPAHLQPFFPHIVQDNSLYILYLVIYILSRKSKKMMQIFWLLIVALIISSIPGLIGIPNRIYLRAIQSSYFMTWFFVFIIVFLRIKNRVKKIYV